MRVQVPVIVKDPEVSEDRELQPTEQIRVEEESFLDGPISPRVAILDFDPSTGRLLPGVPFQEGEYVLPRLRRGAKHVTPAAGAVSTFGAVHKTLEMFEEQDALGRRIAWAFGAPQLLVVPRAGEWANAFYERESHSLQFFLFRAQDGRWIHTSHSQDIVAHEAAHAILDGIAPDLYTAASPQALAIHEAVADLAALLCSLRCRELTQRVLRKTRGNIEHSRVFSGLAEQFAEGTGEGGRYLRDLNNEKSLKERVPASKRVDPSEPHALSEVLSGAFYRLLMRLYDELREQLKLGNKPDPLVSNNEVAYVQRRIQEYRSGQVSADSKALFIAAERLKRTLIRGLDYLPPGDASFADLGRAVLAADEASHPENPGQREWLIAELVRRGVVRKRADLEVETNYDHRPVGDLDLETLVASDYAAYQFANANRKLLGIPKGEPFEVRPRLDVKKLYWHRETKDEVRECLFKVAWSEVEPSPAVGGLPRRRRLIQGTTLAIEWTARPRVRAVLTTRREPAQVAATDELIRRLVDQDVLRVGDRAQGPTGRSLRGVVRAHVAGGVLRIQDAGRMLHISGQRP